MLCLNDADGQIVWQHEYDCSYTVSYPAGPRVTPTVYESKVYTLGSEGHLSCLDAESGTVLWARDFRKDFGIKTPTWGFAGHPLADGKKLICLAAGEGSVAVAFDKDTGAVLWRALSSREPGYAPPMIYEFAGKRQLIIWHQEAVNGLDPATGSVLWTHRAQIRSGMSIPSPRQLGDRLFLTSFYGGSIMLRINASAAPEVLWHTTKSSEKDTAFLHSVMSTPVVLPDHIYGSCSYGQFRCLKTGTGERVCALPIRHPAVSLTVPSRSRHVVTHAALLRGRNAVAALHFVADRCTRRDHSRRLKSRGGFPLTGSIPVPGTW